MTQAFVFSVSQNDVEHNYPYLSLLLLESIKATNPDVDAYCGILTDNPPDAALIKELEGGCNVVVDPVYRVTGHRDYSMRPATCHYFKHLLSRYSQLVYIDIDAVISRPFDYVLHENSFLHDTWPEAVVAAVERPKPDFFTFPWLSIINDSNCDIYRPATGREFSRIVQQSELTLVPNDFTTFYSWRPYKQEHLAFHYDGFNYCGYAHMLKKLPFYHRLQPIIERYFSFDRIVPFYWERFFKGDPLALRLSGVA